MSNSVPSIGMRGPGGSIGIDPRHPTSDDARLHRAAEDLEGIFVAQLFKAMRQTVPDNGVMDGGAGEKMFSALMDEHLAALVPREWQHGMGDALYRQLRGALGNANTNIVSTSGEGDSR